MSNSNKFGKCRHCGDSLVPITFIKKETRMISGTLIHTERVAIDYLTCENCFRDECIDDSFDGIWYKV